jgi:hypothetical protein
MRNALRFLSLVVVFAASAAAWPAGQQGPIGQGPQQPAVGTGFIAGQVVDVPAGKPVSEVQVVLITRSLAAGRGAQPNIPPVLTDTQGRFFFASLPAGGYTLSMSRSGYSVSAGSVPAIVDLGDGERVIDLRLKLAKGASLSGSLRDEAGDPVVGTDVVILRRTINNGRQTLSAAGKSRSDDRGQYRASLSPGDYVVCACGRDIIPFDGTLLTTLGSEPLQLLNVAARALSVGSDVVSLDNTLRTYAPTLYPNAITLARSTKVTLAPGEDRTDVDISLPLVRAARVSGRIIGATGPIQAGSMALVPAPDGEANANLFSLQPMLVQADGRFDFTTVPPGQYRFMMVYRDFGARSGGPSGAAMGFVGARGATPPPAGATMSAGNAPAQDVPPLWANETVIVPDGGITGLVISLNKSPSVRGRVEWVGAAPPPPAQMLQRASVSMLPASTLDPFSALMQGAIGRFSPDATFVVAGAVPGKYIISSNPLPGYPTLKSVVVGGTDITDLPFEVGEKDVAEVVLTYVDTPMATLTVTTNPLPGSRPYDDAWTLVFPADRKFWTEPSAARRRFQSLPLSNRGLVVTGGLPAGDYIAVIVAGFEIVDWQEATKLDALSKRGQRVTVGETGAARIEVRR